MDKFEPGQRVKYFPMVRSTIGVDAIYLGSEGGRAKVQRLDMKNPTVVNPAYIEPTPDLGGAQHD